MVVDLHTGAINRANLPQVRVTADDEKSLQLANAFGAPVILTASVREGTVRAACNAAGVPVILYEGGEALRLDTASIRFGKRGLQGGDAPHGHAAKASSSGQEKCKARGGV